jgi:hypothetical protein
MKYGTDIHKRKNHVVDSALEICVFSILGFENIW